MSASDHSSVEWIDITTDFLSNCRHLGQSESIHRSHFDLVDAMSSIEMCDVKMDLTVTALKERRIKSIENAREMGVFRVEEEENLLCCIHDEMLRHMASWLDGQCMNQTLLTCVYIQRPELIENNTTLTAISYCFSFLVLTCRLCIISTKVSNDEEYQNIHNGGAYFLNTPVISNITEVKCHQLLTSVAGKWKGTKMGARLDFLSVLIQMAAQIMSSKQRSDLGGKLEQVCTGVLAAKAEKTFNSFKMGFEPWLNLATMPPAYPHRVTIMNFSKAIGLFRGIAAVASLCSEIRKHSEEQNFGLNTLFQALDFLFSSSSDEVFLDTILCRSVLIAIFDGAQDVPNEGTGALLSEGDLRKLIIKSLNEATMPPCLALDYFKNDTIYQGGIEDFLVQVSRLIYQLVAAISSNSVHRREKLSFLIQEFCQVCEISLLLDHHCSLSMGTDEVFSSFEKPHIGSVETWTICYQLKLMLDFVLVGFDLELYSHHEFPYIYWYTSQCLHYWYLTTYSKANSHYETNDQIYLVYYKKNKKKIKARKSPSRILHQQESVWMVLYRDLASGMLSICLALKDLGFLRQPQPFYNDEAKRYEYRFSAFSKIKVPPYVTYEQFLMAVSTQKSLENGEPCEGIESRCVQNHFNDAVTHFSDAREGVSRLLSAFDNAIGSKNQNCRTGFLPSTLPLVKAKLDGLLVVAKKNEIVAKVLKASKVLAVSRVEFEFKESKVFPVVKLVMGHR